MIRLTGLLIVLFMIGCYPKKKETSKQLSDKPTTTYSEHAVIITKDGSFYQGPEKISQYKPEHEETDSFNTIYSTKANIRYQYEIRSFNSSGNSYKQLLIFEIEDPSKRAFDLTIEEDTVGVDTAIINKKRTEWIERCNEHDASVLVDEVYAAVPLYYNHKPMIADREALKKEYGYMNNPDYSLRLIPLHVEKVTNEIIFEIGQCSGSYNGKYILVWKKDENEIWSVWIDSNI